MNKAFLSMIFFTLLLSLENSFAEEFLKQGKPEIVPVKRVDTQEAPDFASLASTLRSTVVKVSVKAFRDKGKKLGGEPEGVQPPGEDSSRPFRSFGSGFILSEDGYIATNNHVVEHASLVNVQLPEDKREYPAEVIGTDPKTDLALLKITPPGKLSPVFIGNSNDLLVGDWVMAIGNQFQLGQTVTAGIVSAKARRVPGAVPGPYDAFIQTDASINPGSSGGPLFNRYGQVVGINTAIYSPGRGRIGGTGFNIGIGFSIPVNLASKILTELKEYKKVTRGLLGVVIQPVDSDVAEAMNLQSPEGALVADVLGDSPAGKAGVERGDIIVEYGGQPVREHSELPLMVANTPIGTEVELEVIRGKKGKVLRATISELQDTPKEKEEEQEPNSIGLVLKKMERKLLRALKLPGSDGVVVERVEPTSLALRSGIVAGDIIEEIAGVKVTQPEEVETQLKKLEEGPILVLVRRRQGTRYILLKRDLSEKSEGEVSGSLEGKLP